MAEAAQQHWSVRALDRQIGKLYYERLLSSKDKAAVEQEDHSLAKVYSERIEFMTTILQGVNKTTNAGQNYALLGQLNDERNRMAVELGKLSDPVSGEQMVVNAVIQTLADDIGMTNTRPDSWEGANMQQVIDGHGWKDHVGSK